MVKALYWKKNKELVETVNRYGEGLITNIWMTEELPGIRLLCRRQTLNEPDSVTVKPEG